MEIPTYFGLQWWGDEVSNRWVSGINKNFEISIDKNFFFSRDVQFFEYLAINIIKFYRYKLYSANTKFYFNFFPMKCELLVWRNAFNHKKWWHILSIPFFYLKRILLINKFTIKNINLPSLCDFVVFSFSYFLLNCYYCFYIIVCYNFNKK